MGWLTNLGTSQGAATGAAINIADTTPNKFIDLFKGAAVVPGLATQYAEAQLDDNQYPTQNFTGDIAVNYGAGAQGGVPYRFIWQAGTKGAWFFGGAFTGATVAGTGGSISAASGSDLVVTVDGTGAGYAIFTPTNWNNGRLKGAPASGWGAAGTARVAVVRDGDFTNGDYTAGKTYTREYLDLLRGLNPKTIRTMGWMLGGSGSENNIVSWDQRCTPTTFGWRGNRVYGKYWAGGYGANGQITGTDRVTASASTSTGSGAWAADQALQGNLVNAFTKITVSAAISGTGSNVQLTVNAAATVSVSDQVWIAQVGGTTEANGVHTVTAVDTVNKFVTIDVPFVHAYTSGGIVGTQTVTITGKGTKFLSSVSGLPIFANFDLAPAGVCTMTYDAILDRVIYSPTGFNFLMPMEAMCDLCNNVNANLHPTIPWFADDEFVRRWSITARDYLKSTLYFMPEYANEVGWSFQFPGSQWVSQIAVALGFSNSVHDFYALRVRQVMEIVGTTWASRKYRLRRLLAYQGSQGESTTLGHRMKGSHLSSYGYDTIPNRPVDFCEGIAPAPYAGGCNYSMGTDVSNNFGPGAHQAPFFQQVIDAWDAGNTALCVSLIDDDIRQGRCSVLNVTASGSTFTTATPHGWTNGVQIQVAFQGALYSNISAAKIYWATITGASTFTCQDYSNGFPAGASISAGTSTGTMNVGLVGRIVGGTAKPVPTIQVLNSTMHAAAEWLASSMDGDRPAGMAAIRIEQYEGNLEPKGLTMSQASSLSLTSASSTLAFTASTTSSSASVSGISSSIINGLVIGATVTGTNITGTPTIISIDTILGVITLSSGAAVTGTGTGVSLSMSGAGAVPAGNLQQALIAWKNDVAAAATQKYYFDQFMTFSHAKTPSHLVLLGGGDYGLISGSNISDPKWQMYYGFAAFNSGVS